MSDPLADVVTLLQPAPTFSKVLSGAGRWRASRKEIGQPFYCVVLEGELKLSVNSREALSLQTGDFVLVPEVFRFTASSIDPPEDDGASSVAPTALPDGSFRFGDVSAEPDAQWLAGLCEFGAPDTALLVSLLPELVLVRGDHRLAVLVKLVRDESLAQRPARKVVLARLLEVLFIEALRSVQTGASPGLVRGLSDPRLALAIREMHESPDKPWTVAQLAKTSALSRSAFFDRFSRAVGVAPMAYLLSWRLAVAKNLLRRSEFNVAMIAERVGYSSASAFSVAFTRHVGVSPTQYAQGSAGRMAG